MRLVIDQEDMPAALHHGRLQPALALKKPCGLDSAYPATSTRTRSITALAVFYLIREPLILSYAQPASGLRGSNRGTEIRAVNVSISLGALK